MPKFQDFDELVISIANTKALLKKKFRIESPAETATQNCLKVAGTNVITDNPALKDIGITHIEGGWPRDINRLDEEQTARYRKKQEKDEAYITQMKGMIKACEHAIFQNNAINLYENYFEDLESVDLKDEYSSKTLNIYRDKTKVS
jgi:dynein intermediate chain 2, axonemal